MSIAAIYLYVVIIGTAEDHWSRHPMLDMKTCQQALSTRRVDLPSVPKQINSVLMYCATETHEFRSEGKYKP